MSARVLIVDDDETLRTVLMGALHRREYEVFGVGNADAAINMSSNHEFDFAVVDLRMPGPSGLVVIEALVRANPRIRVVVLTGYASIATAVEAIKLGAVHYLTKPANADEIISAFGRNQGDTSTRIAENPPSVGRVEWEHIQRVLSGCQGNISLAARQLGMHRRTLQRKLQKRPVRI